MKDIDKPSGSRNVSILLDELEAIDLRRWFDNIESEFIRFKCPAKHANEFLSLFKGNDVLKAILFVMWKFYPNFFSYNDSNS